MLELAQNPTPLVLSKLLQPLRSLRGRFGRSVWYIYVTNLKEKFNEEMLGYRDFDASLYPSSFIYYSGYCDNIRMLNNAWRRSR